MPLHDYRALSSDQGDDSLPSDILDTLAAGQDSRVKILRKHRDLTQNELAKKAGISRPYLAEIETGTKDGSISAFKQLAEALDVDIALLIAP